MNDVICLGSSGRKVLYYLMLSSMGSNHPGFGCLIPSKPHPFALKTRKMYNVAEDKRGRSTPGLIARIHGEAFQCERTDC